MAAPQKWRSAEKGCRILLLSSVISHDMSSKNLGDSRSSFAQSFFQSGSDDSGDDDRKPNFPLPKSRPLSRRSLVRRSTSGSISNEAAEAAAQLAAQAFDGDASRSSWYEDALRQGNASDLQDLLNIADYTEKEEHQGYDKEVLEQYRIMAQCEAQLRVKENIGFDMQEYQASHKLNDEPATDKRALFGVSSKKSKFRLPEPKRPSPESTKLKTEEPPLLPPRPDLKLVQQKCKRVSELLEGTVSKDTSTVPRGDHKVKCLACRCTLQVNQLATLVKCPECSVISPASSTRR